MNDKELQNLIYRVVSHMEDEAGRSTYRVTISTGKSGLSYGRMQNDVLKNPEARKPLMKILEADGVSEKERRAIGSAKEINGTGNNLTPEQIARITKALSSEKGKPLVDAQDKAQAAKLVPEVRKVITAAKGNPKGAGAFDPKHPDFQKAVGLTASWINRTGAPDQLTKFVRGEQASMFDQTKPVQLPADKAPSLDALKTQYFPAAKQFVPKDKTGNGEDLAKWLERFDRAHKAATEKPAPTDGTEPKPGADAKPSQGDEPGASPPEGDKPPAPDGEPQAGAGKAPDAKTMAADDFHRQESDALQARLGEKEDPMDEILLKRPKKWTEDELHTVMASDDYWGGSERSGEALSKTGAWFDHVYGDKRATSENLRLAEVRIPSRPQPAFDPAGGDLLTGVRKVGFRLADKALETGWPKAVTTLQSGLNELAANPARPDSADGYGRVWTPSLKEDGDLGPKTRLALKQNVAAFGSPTIMRLLDEDPREGLGI